MEQKQETSKSNHIMVERDIKTDNRRELKREISEPITKTVDTKQVTFAQAAEGKITNEQFLESKLLNFKKFVSEIAILEKTGLNKMIQALTSREVLEWVIWVKNEGKGLDSAIEQLFTMHKLKSSLLKTEEYEKIKLYFICFQTIATQ